MRSSTVGIVALIRALSSEKCTLQTLDIDLGFDFEMDDDGAVALAGALSSEHCTLSCLRIRESNYSKDGVLTILTALSSEHCTLRQLDVKDLGYYFGTSDALYSALHNRSAANPPILIGLSVSGEDMEGANFMSRERCERYKKTAKVLLLWANRQAPTMLDPVRKILKHLEHFNVVRVSESDADS